MKKSLKNWRSFFKIDNAIARVSINLNPLHRGKKLAASLLGSAMNEILIISPKIKHFVAELNNNNASIKIFTQNGFALDTVKADFGIYRRTTRDLELRSMFEINGHEIGETQPPYIIAEISANHNGKIDNAFKIIDMAKRAGADAIKMQTYTPDTITLNSTKSDFQIKDGLWAGTYLYELYSKAFTPWEWHKGF